MIRIVAEFQLKPEEKDHAMTLFKELIDATRKEKGCNGYDLVGTNTDNNLLVLLEAWENQEALDSHNTTEHFTRLVPQLSALCTEAPNISTFNQII